MVYMPPSYTLDTPFVPPLHPSFNPSPLRGNYNGLAKYAPPYYQYQHYSAVQPYLLQYWNYQH